MEKLIKNLRASPLKSMQKLPASKLDAVGGGGAGNGLAKKILDLQIQLAELESEYVELKESNEFLADERLVLEESLRESEQQATQLRAQKEAGERMLAELDRQLNACRTQTESSDRQRSCSLDLTGELRNEKELLRLETARLQQELQAAEQKRLQAEADGRANAALVEQLQAQLGELREDKEQLGRLLADLKIENGALAQESKRTVDELNAQLLEKEALNQKLVARYLRHRQIWEDNQEKANFEIQKLDEAIDNVIATIKDNLDKIGNIPAIHLLLRQLTNEE